MNIGALSQAVAESGAGLNLPTPGISSDGTFSQNVEKALSSMNKASLKDEQDALDLSFAQGSVASLIMTFFAGGGSKINLQDAQIMADKILGSDAMLDLLSYNEVSLNDIFLSNLNGGVLNGSQTLGDKIQNMDFTQLIDAIKGEISADIDLDSNFKELISQVMDEIAMNVNESSGKEQVSQSSAIFSAIGQLKTDADQKKDSNGTQANSEGVAGVQGETVEEAGESVYKQEANRNQSDDNLANKQDVEIDGFAKAKNQVDTKQEVKTSTHNSYGSLGTEKLEMAEITLKNPIEATTFTTRVLESIEASLAKGNDSLFIKLKPDFLGGIAIKLAVSEGGVIARIVTNNEKTQNMLASQLSNLESSLKEKGIDVARMEVLYNPLNGDGQGQSKGDNNQGSKGGSRSYVIDNMKDVDSLEYLQILGEEEEDLTGDVYKA